MSGCITAVTASAEAPTLREECASFETLTQFMSANERWDRAWDALMRKDFSEFDRITGFQPLPSERNA